MQATFSSGTVARRIQRTPFDFAGLLVLLTAFTLMIAIAGWQFWHANRIYTGVSIGDVPLGGLTRAEAVKRLSTQLYAYPLPPVSIEYQGQQWPLQTVQVRADANLLDAVNRAYLVGRHGSVLANLGEQLQSAWRGEMITPPLTIDPAPLRAALEQIADRVARTGVPARVIGSVSVPAQPGIAVDTETTLQAVLNALQDTDLHEAAVVPLSAVAVAPPVEAAVAAEAGGTPAIQRPLLLRSEQNDFELALDPALLNQMVSATEPPQLKAEVLRAYLADVATQVDVAARDARLRFNPATGGLTVLQDSWPGQELDIDATMQSVQSAVAAGSDQATLAIVAVAPSVDSNRIAEMGIHELVASGSTYFAGSSASRVHNIEVAAEKFDGVVIPPGEIFSFNKIVRDVSSANGFEDSLVIWGDRTAVGVGGGVCQVSTTVFRTAYEGGFPIVERYNHGYVVDWYGEPGMDATIFTPTVDFRFRNDTNAFLLIEPVVDSANGVITFNFYGSKPERTVTIGKPQIAEVKQPEPPNYVVDESLAAGEKKQVEWQKDGMTATVTRTIVENGTTRTDTLVSKYQPWRAVYLVGPGTEVPAMPTPTPTPGLAGTTP